MGSKPVNELVPSVGVMYEHLLSVDKGQDILFQLTDIEALLTLTGIIPLLHEINVLV